jgi:Dolichyl-phosphate-mannose-protein mannosyltransferase
VAGARKRLVDVAPPLPAQAQRVGVEVWTLAVIVALGAALRFATLDLQSYTHEEAVTASRVLHAGLGDTLAAIPDSESTPPFYYLLAWLWSVPFGVGEVALRSLSALIGLATIPVAYLAGRELSTPRIGLVAAGLIAASPMLIWYSQLARAYSLLVLLSALSFLFAVKALHSRGGRDLAAWAVCSAFALATHYFALFLVGPAGVLLLARLRSRAAVGATVVVVASGLALLPLAVHQADIPNNDWISHEPLLDRLKDVPRKFLVGETGAYSNVFGRRTQSAYLNRALIPGVIVLAALVLLLRFADHRERRAAWLALGIGGGATLAATALAVVGTDYLLARNLLPAYVPLAIVVSCGLGARRARWRGAALAVGLCALLAAFAIYSSARPALQHDDWRGVANALGPAGPRRAIVAPFLGDDPLIYYLGGNIRRDNSFVGPMERVVIVGYGPPRGRSGLAPAFSQQSQRRVSYFTITAYRAPRPTLVRARQLATPEHVGSTKAAVLIDGSSLP